VDVDLEAVFLGRPARELLGAWMHAVSVSAPDQESPGAGTRRRNTERPIDGEPPTIFGSRDHRLSMFVRTPRSGRGG
jgi:hypothetical protein